jgi:5-methylcytosine-specific restriction endonuclease McrA
VLDRDRHLCRLRHSGCQVRANTVHHVIARTDRQWAGMGLRAADQPGNLIAVCPSCHNTAHPEKGGR